MALIQFDHPTASPPIKIQKRMFAPKKKVSELEQWLKDCRKKIPEIPICSLLTGWEIVHTDISPNHIIIDFVRHSNFQIRARLTIDRLAASIG